MANKTSAINKLDDYQLLTCSCEGTMAIDIKKIAKGLGMPKAPEVYNNLCRAQLASFEKSAGGKKTLLTCTQEAPMFDEVAADLEDAQLKFVNIRENAGWSNTNKNVPAKMAALIAEGIYEANPARLLAIRSEGSCLVYGGAQQALDIATKLAGRLNITLVLSNFEDVFVPASTDFPIYSGIITQCKGSMGKFECVIENYSAKKPSAKSQIEFQGERKTIRIGFDLIFDVSGGETLVGGGHGRDGYFHVEPNNRVKIAESMFEIVDLVGEFEKPIFVTYDDSICAHSRSGKTGCSNCIDACPTAAIEPNGEGIIVNNEICDGCGNCSSSCPTGAIAYDFPARGDIVGRCQTLISTYMEAGGKNPVILLHETKHGGDLIAAIARFGNGLPGNVIPLAVHTITHIGHDILSAMFTTGVQNIVALAPLKKRDAIQSLQFQIDLTNTFLGALEFEDGVGVNLLNEDDPDVVGKFLESIPDASMPSPLNFAPSANKRETAHLALANLNKMAPTPLASLELPEHSPYGKISIDTESCTLCLACVGACPASALGDNENKPQVLFTEHACVQCGLCASTCPENAITLVPEYNFEKSAMQSVVLNEEEPLECTSCGKPFGSKSAIEKVMSILEGKNPMFKTSAQMALLKMCDNCRVIEMSLMQKDPMTVGTVPRVMTADDILPEDEEPTKH